MSRDATKDGPLDVYGGPGDWTPNEPGEMTPDQLNENIAQLRRTSAPGTDDAYAMGLSEHYTPTPEEGWPEETTDDDLTP